MAKRNRKPKDPDKYAAWMSRESKLRYSAICLAVAQTQSRFRAAKLLDEPWDIVIAVSEHAEAAQTVGQETDPTPEEIREMCLEIQKGWTEKEREERLVGFSGQDDQEYSIPLFRLRSLFAPSVCPSPPQ